MYLINVGAQSLIIIAHLSSLRISEAFATLRIAHLHSNGALRDTAFSQHDILVIGVDSPNDEQDFARERLLHLPIFVIAQSMPSALLLCRAHRRLYRTAAMLRRFSVIRKLTNRVDDRGGWGEDRLHAG